jgi:hypothetical protein
VGPREVFVNDGANGNHRMTLSLRGLASNGSGIGARVRFVSASGTRWRTRLGESDNCFSDQALLHVGLGADTVVDTLEVFWPSGQVDTFTDVAADRGYWAVEGFPMREFQELHFIVPLPFVDLTLDESEMRDSTIAVDNYGGLASTYSVRCEDCAGSPISWISVDPDTGGVWPGGGRVTLRTDATGLPFGAYCGRAIFDNDGQTGADTLVVNLSVESSLVGAPAAAGLPARFALGPNPARDHAELVLALPAPDRVDVEVLSVAGRRVATILAAELPAGRHTLAWDGRDGSGARVAAGVYLIRAASRAGQGIRKVTILD